MKNGHDLLESQELRTNLCENVQAPIKIKSELKAWVERESGINNESEVDLPVEEFLTPLGLSYMVEKLKDIGCFHVRDMMSMTNHDLVNLGIKSADDRKMLLSRFSTSPHALICSSILY